MEQIDPKQLKKFPERFHSLIRILVTAINLCDPELVYNLINVLPARWEELKPLIRKPGQGPSASRGKVVSLSEYRESK